MNTDIIDTESDEERAAAQTAAAFAAAPFKWKDITLGAFAVDVEADWLIHRRVMGSPPLIQLIGDRAALSMDAFRVLWFCAVDDAEWRGQPHAETDRKIRDWARKNIEPDDMPAAVDFFLAIYNRSQKTRAVVVNSGPHSAKKKPSPSPLFRPNTSRSSRAPAPACSPSTSSATSSRRSVAGPTSTRGRSSKATKRNGLTKGTPRASGGRK